MEKLCIICGRSFDTPESELEYDELDQSGRVWNEKEEMICDNCKEDSDIDD